ncbi:hypothetical protein ACT4S2_02680 [Kocuria turfanensis]|uniref:hypothetical protein n=1 Tax=Kocuria turfanensis TaxID=388357 RepID=UPI0040366B89
MANSLGSAQYSDFAAAQMLLGIAGTIAAALVPLPLSHAVATYPAGSAGRREGIAFAFLVSLLIGSIAAVVTGTLTAAFAPAPMAMAVGLSCLMFFLVSASHGWLQGELRFKWYAVTTLAEIVIRLGFSVLVVAMAWGATGAVLGFALGALALLVVPLSFYQDLRFQPTTLKQRWRWSETADIALVLCVVSALIGLDVVIIAFLDDGSDAAAGFQALATIAKGPVYIAAGTALVAFPLLRSPNVDTAKIVARALRSFGVLALPAAAVIATVPHQLMALVLPDRYHPALHLMPWLAAAGLGYALLSVLATILLALRCYRYCQLGLATAALFVTTGILIGWHLDEVRGLAIGSAAGALLAAAAMTTVARPQMPQGTARWALRAALATTALTGLLTAAASGPVFWLLIAALSGTVVLMSQQMPEGGLLDMLSSVRNRWRTRAPVRLSPVSVLLVGWTLVVGVAFSVRAVGLARSFELQGDELLYAELGRSVSFGQWPKLELKDLHDGPFFLHPPGFFLVEGLVINIFRLSGDSFDLVYDLRWLNAVIGALSVGVGFLLIRKLTNLPVAALTAIVLTFEPFVLRNHSRVYIETFGTAVTLTGLLVIVSSLMHHSFPVRKTPVFLGGMLLGYGVLTKDVFVLLTVAPIVLAILWRRTIPKMQAALILLGSSVPYAVYLFLLEVQGMMPGWLWAKSYGARRMLGFQQETGFNAEGTPSLASRMIEQAGSYGTSYVLLAAGPTAALLVCFSPRADRRLIGLAGLLMGVFGLFCAAFGALEEQYGYPVMVAGILSIAVFSVEVCARWPHLFKSTAAVGVVFTLSTVFLGVRAETTSDNGFAQFRQWAEVHLPADAKVSVTNITAELAFAQDDPRFGAWPSPEMMEQNNAEYMLTQSMPTMQGYGYTPPEMLEWLAYTSSEVVSFDGPTNGTTTLWRVEGDDLRRAADADFGLPMENYYEER